MTWRFAGCSAWLALSAFGCAGKSSEAAHDRARDITLDAGADGSEENDGDDDESRPIAEPAPPAPAEPEPAVDALPPEGATPEPVEAPDPAVTPSASTPVAVGPSAGTAEPCAGMCGNGVVDACEICPDGTTTSVPAPLPQGTLPDVSLRVAPVPFEPLPPSCFTRTEACDGSVGATCEEIGFTSGVLQCGELCTMNQSGCESCGTDEHIVACRDDVSSSGLPRMLALAAKATEVALVWTHPEAGVYFSVLDEALEPIVGETHLWAPAIRVAVATLPIGWVIVADENRFVLDANGVVLSQTTVVASSPVFAASRQDSTPLLVAMEASENIAVATLLGEDGTPVWETDVTSSPSEPDYGSAAAIQGGFLVALRGTNGVEVWHLDEQNGVSTSAGPPGTSATEYPQLASNGNTAAIVWADFSIAPSVYWAPLDSTGARSGEAVMIGGSPDYFNRSPIVMDGEETIVLFGGYTGGTGVGSVHSVRRIDGTGETVYGDYPLQNDPNAVLWPQLARMGDRVVAAWIAQGEPGRVGVATLTP